MYWLKVYELPSGGRGAKGKPLVNILPLAEGERVTTLLPIDLAAYAGQDDNDDDDGRLR